MTNELDGPKEMSWEEAKRKILTKKISNIPLLNGWLIIRSNVQKDELEWVLAENGINRFRYVDFSYIEQALKHFNIPLRVASPSSHVTPELKENLRQRF